MKARKSRTSPKRKTRATSDNPRERARAWQALSGVHYYQYQRECLVSFLWKLAYEGKTSLQAARDLEETIHLQANERFPPSQAEKDMDDIPF